MSTPNQTRADNALKLAQLFKKTREAESGPTVEKAKPAFQIPEARNGALSPVDGV